jgi:hypothetical protein
MCSTVVAHRPAGGHVTAVALCHLWYRLLSRCCQLMMMTPVHSTAVAHWSEAGHVTVLFHLFICGVRHGDDLLLLLVLLRVPSVRILPAVDVDRTFVQRNPLTLSIIT